MAARPTNTKPHVTNNQRAGPDARSRAPGPLPESASANYMPPRLDGGTTPRMRRYVTRLP
jgi:hypothetical protein